MACEPFDCERCGEHHDRCAGHVDLYDEEGNRTGERSCRRWPFTGARVCDSHGGGAPQVRTAAIRRTEAGRIRREVERLGTPIETDPEEALLNELWETVGNIEKYRAMIQELPDHPEPDQIIGFDDKTEKPIYERGAAGIYGRTYHLSGVPTGEAKPNVLVQMYNEERKHLLAVTGTAIRLGIEERRVRLEEGRANEVFRAITDSLTAMGLVDRFDEFRGHFANSISEIRQLPRGA